MLESTSFMILGYALTLIILGGLVGYLVLRARNLREELAMLETLEEEGRLPDDGSKSKGLPAADSGSRA